MNTRIRTVSFILLLVIGIVVGRLFFWQVVRGQELAKVARSQYLRGEALESKRGTILASDGQPLASSQIAWTLWAQPQKFTVAPGEIAESLANELIVELAEAPTDKEMKKSEKERIYKLLTRENTQLVLVREKISTKRKTQIENLNLKGISFKQDESRMYAEGTMAAHILGFVGKNSDGEDQGYFGLEGFYNISLTGKSGYRKTERDARGNPIPFGDFLVTSPVPGVNLVTNIDRSIQFIIEKTLEEGVQKYGALWGSIIVAKPTGEILALANYPSYDPSRYSQFDQELYKNKAASDLYEPGSIFKVIVMAAALDVGVVEPDTHCDSTCNGPIIIDKYSIKTYNNHYYPNTTMTEVIVHSDNTGMVFAASKLGLDKLWEYISKFGFGKPTGIDIQEEANIELRNKREWSEVDLATLSFGQGIAINSMQYVRALAAIANKGVLPTMKIVQKLSKDGWEQEMSAKSGYRVISEEAARKITEMMVAAVDQGEGVVKLAKPQGFKVAGKSGTAQIAVDGEYSSERTIASYAGFAPADNPQFVMLVILREPTANPWGANTAAPMWFSIARDLFPYFGIQPSN